MSNRTVLRMRGKAPLFLTILLGAGLLPALAAAESKSATPGGLSAAQIVDKHAAARGGLQAWRAVQTLSVTGKLEAGSGDSAARSAKLAREGVGASGRRSAGSAPTADSDKAAGTQQVLLPFRLEMQRPRKSRLEIDFAGKTAVQAYDGQNGWKLRPFLNRDDVEPFTADEAKAEAAKADLRAPWLTTPRRGPRSPSRGWTRSTAITPTSSNSR